MHFWELLDISNTTKLESTLNGSAVLIWSNFTQSSRLGLSIGDSRWAFEWFKRQGVAAVVVMNTQSNQPGGNEVLIDRWDWCKELHPMMVVEVGLADARTMIAWARNFSDYQQTMVISLPGNEVSPWRQVRNHKVMIAYQVWFAIISATASIIALTKLIAFIRHRGLILSLAVVLLSIEFITNLWRLIYFSLDPVYLGRLFPGPVAHGLSTITWPMGCITMLLVGMYYQEVISSSKLQISNNVKRLQKPFIGITIVIIALEIVSSSIRASRVGTLYVLVYITTGYYIIASSLLGAYFCYVGVRVLRYFKKAQTKLNVKSNKKTNTTKRVTIFLLGTAGCAFFTTIGYILCAIPPFWTPVGHYVAWCTSAEEISLLRLGYRSISFVVSVSAVVVYTGLIAGSLTQVLSVKMPRGSLTGTMASSSINKTASRGLRTTGSSRAATTSGGSSSAVVV